MPRTLTSSLAFLDPPAAEPHDDEGLLSRTFLRGFAAGQNLSSREFVSLLPTLLDEFVQAHPSDPGVRAFAERFGRFARERAARLGVDVGYLAEGAGI